MSVRVVMKPDVSAQPWEFPPFNPPRWLRNPHLQTLVAAQIPRRFNYGWRAWEPTEISIGKDGRILAEAYSAPLN
jgi:predicted alpha/beta-fold hydrolase